MKLYILARKDAPLGKVMAHVGHVCCHLFFYFNGEWSDKKNNRLWDWMMKYNQTKIILSVENEEKLMEWLKKTYGKCGLDYTSFNSVIDIHTNEHYCLAIGPLTDNEAQELGLKKLRLFK